MPRRWPESQGIFAVEITTWEPDDLKDARSLAPVLDVIAAWCGSKFRTLHRTVATLPEFEHYIELWGSRSYRSYQVLWISAHGRRGEVVVDADERSKQCIDLRWLGARLARRAHGRVIHFSSCLTLCVSRGELQDFLRVTGAIGVLGYSKRVCWLRSLALEMQTIPLLFEHSPTRRGMQAFVCQAKRESSSHMRQLGMRLVVAD